MLKREGTGFITLPSPYTLLYESLGPRPSLPAPLLLPLAPFFPISQFPIDHPKRVQIREGQNISLTITSGQLQELYEDIADTISHLETLKKQAEGGSERQSTKGKGGKGAGRNVKVEEEMRSGGVEVGGFKEEVKEESDVEKASRALQAVSL